MSDVGLVGARSAYVRGAAGRGAAGRGAAGQAVRWREWEAAAFAEAVREDKPVLLVIGAVWCHWCGVMDAESYGDAETARIINEHFVAVRVDRDERPEVDARYQAAVAAISGGGGWPLTAFLTPEGKPFFGGTYFPAVDGHGRPGLRRVLMTMAEAFEKTRGEVEETAASVVVAVEESENFLGGAGVAGEELVGKIVQAALGQFDARFGGFGGEPKFPNACVLDLLIDEGVRGVAEARRVVEVTLRAMARGGIYDHQGGGFHRYSVDERWVVPHFEKMLAENAGLLRVYVRAYGAWGDEEFARVARETMGWVDGVMSDRARGGFYAAQVADVGLGDGGDYWTWTREEAAGVLTAEELAVVERDFHLGVLGDMRHRPEKCVLRGFVSGDVRGKMLAARERRERPFVDEAAYVGWNGLMVSSYLLAGRVLGEAGATEFGLRTLDRVLREAWDGGRMRHELSGGDGGLEDYVYVGLAALDAFEVTGEVRYREAAVGIAGAVVGKFWDEGGGGFFDAEAGDLGMMGVRRKALQDAPTVAGNAAAAELMLRVGFEDKARRTLEGFAGVVGEFGMYGAGFAGAVRRLVG